MDDGSGQVEELTLEPGDGGRSIRPRALWAVLAAVAVAAGALVVTSAGDDGTSRPGLPVALGSSIAPREASGAAADAMFSWVTYVAGEDLPALGGEAPAYRLPGTVTEAQVQALAAALGLDGEVVHDGPGWTVTDGIAYLEVYEGGAAQWWYSAAGGGTSTGSAGCDGGPDCATMTTTDPECGVSGDATTCIVTECPASASCTSTEPTTTTTVCGPAADCAVSAPRPCDAGGVCAEDPTTTVVCGPAADCVDVAPPPDCVAPADGSKPCAEPAPVPPLADLPSQDEARAIALDLLRSTGVDVDGAVVTIDGPFDAWYVTVEPRLDGVLSGLSASVSVGSHGDVTSAAGYLADPERLGDYPVLDTRAAIDRANAQSGQGVGIEPALGATDDAQSTSDRAAEDAVSSCVAGVPADECTDTGSAIAPAVGDVEATVTTVPPCAPQPDGSEICQSVDSCAEADGQSSTTAPCDVPPPCTVVGTTGSSTTTMPCVPLPCPPGPAEGDPQLGAPYVVGCVPQPDPAPLEITLVDAEPSLVLLGATDGSTDMYLVPGYRFTDENGGRVDLPAVADSALTTPSTTETTATDPGDPPVTPTVAPHPCDEVLVAEDASGTTHTVQPTPCVQPDPQILGEGQEPEIGIGYYVDVDLTCRALDLGGVKWILDEGDVTVWTDPGERHEGGTFTLDSPDHGTFVGDAAATKTATFRLPTATEQIDNCEPVPRG